MLLKYEFTKHINKFNIIFVVVMLLFNIGITVYQYRYEFTGEAKNIRETKQHMLELYITDKTQYNTLYNDYLDRKSEYTAQYYIALADDKSIPIFKNMLLDYPNYGDTNLFSDIDKTVNASANYQKSLYSLLRETASRIKAADSRDSYTYKYYIKLINEYDSLKDKSWDITVINGWNEFFSLQTSSVFLVIASLGIFCGVFTIDRRAGFTNVLNISKKGRREVTSSKLAYITIVSALLTVGFTLAPLVVFALSTGLSSPGAPIQALDGFIYCRYDFTIWQYFAIYIIVRLIIFLCISYLIAVIGQFAKNEIPSFVFIIIIAASGILLKNISSGSKYYALQKFNLVDISNVNILFNQLKGVNIFNNFVDYTYFIIAVFIFAAIAVALSSILKKTSRAAEIIKERKSAYNKKPYLSISVFAAENYKLLVCENGIYIFAAAVILKFIISGIYFYPANNPMEFVYSNYMERLKGPVTDEKLSFIEGERDYIYNTLDEYSKMRDLFQNGEITYKEYQTYLGKYNYANFCRSSCDRMCERRDYLLGINESHPDIEFIYEEGINRLLGASIDITAVLAALFICGNMFAIEHETGFYKILRLTKKGRAVTFRNKIILTLVASSVIFIIFSAIDIYSLHKYYDTDYLGANIMSIPGFSEFNIDISILSYVIIYKAISFTGYGICFLFIALLSVILQNQIKTIIISALAIFLPYILEYYKIYILRFLSITYFMSPENIKWGLAGGLCCTAATAVISAAACYKWSGKNQAVKHRALSRSNKSSKPAG